MRASDVVRSKRVCECESISIKHHDAGVGLIIDLLPYMPYMHQTYQNQIGRSNKFATGSNK